MRSINKWTDLDIYQAAIDAVIAASPGQVLCFDSYVPRTQVSRRVQEVGSQHQYMVYRSNVGPYWGIAVLFPGNDTSVATLDILWQSLYTAASATLGCQANEWYAARALTEDVAWQVSNQAVHTAAIQLHAMDMGSVG